MNNTHTNKSFDKIILDWKLIQSELKLKLGIEVYESWIKKIDLLEEFNNYILLTVPTRFIRDWITSRYLDQILQTIRKHKKQIIRIEFKILEKKNTKSEKLDDLNQIKETQKVSFIKDSHLQYSRIDPNKRFENFLIGSSNKIAFEASLKVSENISHYNPLYMYGGVGLGKTHLLNSIGYEMSKNKKVMFISAERFMYQFVKSIKSNDMVKFKEYFRNTDVLLIDDIQFMNGKEAMQEEFFHTFNALLDKESQIIVSALVGAINRIVSFSRIYNKLPNLSETKVILKDLLNLTENTVTIDTIQTIVCKFFKISKNEMLSSRRSRYLVRPRQTAIYLTKILTTKSLPEIGREFSNRDHTTIIHSVKTIEKLKEKNPDMNDNINKLKNIILYNKEG